jgi:hypothetical protein
VSRHRKSEGPLAGGPDAEQGKNDSADSRTAHADDKRFATLRAQAAIAGHELRREPVGDRASLYVIRRWGLRRELASLDEVQRWIERATGRKVAA